MKSSLIISLMLITAALGGSVSYYVLQKEDLPFWKRDTDCTGSVATLPLVNVTTGMGMTTAIAECDWTWVYNPDFLKDVTIKSNW